MANMSDMLTEALSDEPTVLQQGPTYQETVKSTPTPTPTPAPAPEPTPTPKPQEPNTSAELNQNTDDVDLSELIFNDSQESSTEPKSKLNLEMPKIEPKVVIITIVVILLVAAVGIGGYEFSKDKLPGFAQEVEDGDVDLEPVFQYSPEDIQRLRDNGYTGDEIESYQEREFDVETLIEQAEMRRQALYDAEVKPLLDGASDAYKNLQENTWVGFGNQLDLSNLGEGMNYHGTYNCDYAKVPPYGNQLYIKLYAQDLNLIFFTTVTAERYLELQDKGNIVMNIEYTDYGNGRIVINDVSEKIIWEE